MMTSINLNDEHSFIDVKYILSYANIGQAFYR
jgi:hypothetical protein